jgi:formylglycine-generating enzyme required for sulfatase activity
MLPEKYRWIGVQFEPEGDPGPLLDIARRLEDEGNLEGAATVYDRAFGLDPAADAIREARGRLLDRLAVLENGIVFRYIPGGPFLMGCHTGEPDERPWHPVWLSPYWMSETPLSWATYCRLLGWEPPPRGCPPEDRPGEMAERAGFFLNETNKLRLQYCEDRTTRARDWHAHAAGQTWRQGDRVVTAQELFGSPARDDSEAPWRYDTKPMIAVAWQDAVELAEHLSTTEVRYGLPREAQWEKAARGGRIGARYAWGDEEPARDRCDFDRFEQFSILPMTTFPPNDYGLYAVNGGVWEWTADWYDAEYYRHSAEADPAGPEQGKEKVLRGGSWSDCKDVLTVSFRMSRGSRSWRRADWGDHLAPNIGFRLCRRRTAAQIM